MRRVHPRSHALATLIVAGTTHASIAHADPPCPLCAEDPVTGAPLSVSDGAPTPSSPPPPSSVAPPLNPWRYRFGVGLIGGPYLDPARFVVLEVGAEVHAGWRFAERRRSSLTAYGLFSYATFGFIHELRTAGFVEYTFADRLGIAIGASHGVDIELAWYVVPLAFAGAPLRVAAYGFTARDSRLRSFMVALEAEPAVFMVTQSRVDFGFRAFLSLGYAIH